MSTIRTNHSQAAEQFVTAVRGFEKTHGKKLNEFLAEGKDSQFADEALAKEFFTTPAIHYYLARRSDTIRFLQNKPSDHCLTQVELDIYALRPDLFPFREEADSSSFYLSGARNKEKFFSSLQERYNNQNLLITSSMDIYHIRNYVNRHAYFRRHPQKTEKNYAKFKFILTPNWKDTHATTMVHILEPETGQVLASVFINSSHSKDYSDNISYRFNMKEPIYLHSMQDGEISRETIRIENITGCDIPFIDASHHLQVVNDDYNCTLYGYNFLEAIAKMLSDDNIAKHVFQLAQQNPNDENALCDIFRENLKHYLPCYYDYDDNREPKTKTVSALHEFHLAQRWDLGSEILSQVYPVKLAMEEHKLISEPQRLRTFKPYFNDEKKISYLQYYGNDEVVHSVFNNVISILEREKIRLLEKYPPTSGNAYIAVKRKNKEQWICPEKKINRIVVLETLLDQMYENLAAYEDNPEIRIVDLKDNLRSMISTHLESKTLDKYQSWGKKLALVLLNTLFFLPLITLPFKKMKTGTWLFSLKGKTQEANEEALKNVGALPAYYS